VLQLDFFPRMEFHSLADYQKVSRMSLTGPEICYLAQNPSFFQLQKNHLIITHEHSQLVDRLLGFRIKYIEEMLVAEAMDFDPNGTHDSWGPSIHNGVQTWIGLDAKTLQTPYSEMARIFQLLKLRPYQHVVDLGAAYGRMGALIGGLYPKTLFTGIEYVKARADEGNRVYKELGFSHCKIIAEDLFNKAFQIPEADIYFIYDYGQVAHIEHTLTELKKMAMKRPIRLIVRGKYAQEIILQNHSWLNLAYEGKTAGPYCIYQAYLRHSV